jgi:HTH-type transcriptional regulator/antitoxin HipB
MTMRQFTVRTADQLPALLRAFRSQAGLSQADTALRLGVTQQTYSALERNADRVGAARLLKLLSILGVDLVFSAPDATPHVATSLVKPPATTPSTPTASPTKSSTRRRTGQPDW